MLDYLESEIRSIWWCFLDKIDRLADFIVLKGNVLKNDWNEFNTLATDGRTLGLTAFTLAGLATTGWVWHRCLKTRLRKGE